MHTQVHLFLLPVVRGILIGLGAAAPIGPVNVEMARRTLRSGISHGVALGTGACTVDVFYAVLSSLSVGRFLTHRWVDLTLSILTIITLCYLGASCLRMAWESRTATTDESAEPTLAGRSVLTGYAQGLGMTLINPMTLLFWFVALPGMAKATDQSSLLLTCVGVFLGTFGWVVSFNGILAGLGRFKPRLWMIVADAAGGLTLIGFAVGAFLRSFGPFL